VSLAAVADAGPLIHLTAIDELSLLSAVDRLYVPEIVRAEVEVGGLPDGFSELEYDLVTGNVDPAGGELDPGETAALAVAEERDAVLLTDDLAARETATDAGIEVHGSIGVIALTHARGLLDRDEAAASCGHSSARRACS
jgi:predicted nucleic acid-binding protein